MHLPLMVVFCFRLMPTRSHFPPKRANAVVPVVRVVVVQRTVGIDVADVVGVRRIRRAKPPIPRLRSRRIAPVITFVNGRLRTIGKAACVVTEQGQL